MPARVKDTSVESEQILLEKVRAMSPEEKLFKVFELNRAADQLALAGIRARHGDNLSPREERLRLAALHLDRETMARVFGWDPEVEGL